MDQLRDYYLGASGEGVEVYGSQNLNKKKKLVESTLAYDKAKERSLLKVSQDLNFEMVGIDKEDLWLAYMLVKYCDVVVEGVDKVPAVNPYTYNPASVLHFSEKYLCERDDEEVDVVMNARGIQTTSHTLHHKLFTNTCLLKESLVQNGISAIRPKFETSHIDCITISGKTVLEYYWGDSETDVFIKAPCDGGGCVEKLGRKYITQCDCAASYQFGACSNMWCDPMMFSITTHNRLKIIGFEIMYGLAKYDMYMTKDMAKRIDCANKDLDGLSDDEYVNAIWINNYSERQIIELKKMDERLINLIIEPSVHLVNYAKVITSNFKFEGEIIGNPSIIYSKPAHNDVNSVYRHVLDNIANTGNLNDILCYLHFLGENVNVLKLVSYLVSLGFVVSNSRYMRPPKYINYQSYSKYMSHKDVVDYYRHMDAIGVKFSPNPVRIGNTMLSPIYTYSERSRRSEVCILSRSGNLRTYKISWKVRVKQGVDYANTLADSEKNKFLKELGRYAICSNYDEEVLRLLESYNIPYVKKVDYEKFKKDRDNGKINSNRRRKRSKKNRSKTENNNSA